MKYLLCATAALALGCTAPISAQTTAEAPATTAATPIAPAETLVGDTMPGAFYMAPDGTGPFPTIILLGGSEGNDRGARGSAPRFLAEGYAVLGLPYYSPAWGGQSQKFPDLPEAFDAIPVDTLETARDWLLARADVNAQAIGVYGVSKGAEFALIGGTKIDGFAAIAAIVPTDVVWEGWGPGTEAGKNSSFSWRGVPLPFVPYDGMNEEFANPSGADGRPRLRLPHDKGRHANPELANAAKIAVDQIDEPVLVAGGDADNVWNSGEMAQTISETRAAAGLKTVSLIFTDAGHALSGTGAPSKWASDAEQAAQKVIWPATLAFFAEHLKGE